jgi:hypothetical protein
VLGGDLVATAGKLGMGSGHQSVWEYLGEDVQSRCINAVVVGEEDGHRHDLILIGHLYPNYLPYQQVISLEYPS